jgi:tRNA(fMet)-specific endonuclease VapC
MIILDTDHLSALEYPESARATRLTELMEQRDDEVFVTTAISLEEQMRAWLAAIHRTREVHDQIVYYDRLVGLIDFHIRLEILPFTKSAADRFAAQRSQRVRIGTMDLKIASIVIEAGAMLLSANLRDFERVPGLRVEDWQR